MNKGDCFILDVGKDIYVWAGPDSRRIERLKAVMVANEIRDEDHAGGARVHVIGASGCLLRDSREYMLIVNGTRRSTTMLFVRLMGAGHSVGDMYVAGGRE